MTPTQYAELAMRTAPDLGPKKNVIHASLGMISEVGELADLLKRVVAYGKPFDAINAVEECGDVLWYIVLLCRESKLDFEPLFPQHQYAPDSIDILVEDLANVVGELTTKVRLNLDLDKQATYRCELYLRRIITTLDKICRTAGYSIDIAMDRNIGKLARRYPDGFSDWRALNRDLAAEREVLEGGNPRGV